MVPISEIHVVFLPFSHLLVSSIVPLPPTLSGTIHPVLDLHPFSRTLVVGDGPHYCLPSAGYSLSRFLRAQCRLHASFILVLPPESRAPQRERGLFYLTHDLRLLGHNRPASERQGIDIKSPKFQLSRFVALDDSSNKCTGMVYILFL